MMMVMIMVIMTCDSRRMNEAHRFLTQAPKVMA